MLLTPYLLRYLRARLELREPLARQVALGDHSVCVGAAPRNLGVECLQMRLPAYTRSLRPHTLSFRPRRRVPPNAPALGPCRLVYEALSH